MISYTLKCASGHSFDSWFQSATAFETLQAQGMVSCAICGDTKVEKALMAPAVSKSTSKDEQAKPIAAPDRPGPLSAPKSPAEQAIAALKAHVEKNHHYVGKSFASEARAIHDGDAPERPIWGEARPDEARKLAEDGVPIAPLPFTPTRKSN
ncbi:hypothetical protein FIU97_06020 [Roseivivax sp. THAF40]|uniref:DUF1178 family protein n=1 Tax=unclassified Roseivivax TaxID=2639302 RepID=UPI001267E912|nr:MULTISPECIES: DUF1178 family protein [unclassified Roseivivax]QFS82357.1 hypothetical protein FIV09_05915 [Roseivivax sp. THAF197b]QFT46127.1 hypothetical protein FIU97_06020 [Roseivivax sp. THAF40]